MADVGIGAASPVFNDANGRVANLIISVQRPDGWYDNHSCTATSIKNGYWLSNADCFTTKSKSDEYIQKAIAGTSVRVGDNFDYQTTTIEEMVLPTELMTTF